MPISAIDSNYLMAEYRESTRPFTKVLKRIEKGTMHEVNIPKTYVLGTGHETFFFDKLNWLHCRRFEIFSCLKYVRESHDLDEDLFWQIHEDQINRLEHTPYWNMWKPTYEDMTLNMARLVNKSKSPKVRKEIECLK